MALHLFLHPFSVTVCIGRMESVLFSRRWSHGYRDALQGVGFQRYQQGLYPSVLWSCSAHPSRLVVPTRISDSTFQYHIKGRIPRLSTCTGKFWECHSLQPTHGWPYRRPVNI
ncbi:hypothetical protein BC834DRAFT_475151 [Gloeopeniophorella convolvens]|nr:hypothetical protein BC834DRAFT_475151 [Gloeopeniophorella convolvens]